MTDKNEMPEVEQATAEQAEEQEPDRIVRMVRTAAGPVGGFRANECYAVPGEIPANLAARWIEDGAAVWAPDVTADQLGLRSTGPTRTDGREDSAVTADET